jgi:Concanavalin A-like lectin/glucanases superfamily
MSDIASMHSLSAVTVSAWVKSTSSGANNGIEAHITDKSDCTGSGPAGDFELLENPDESVNFAVYIGGVVQPANTGGGSNIDDGQWHFLTGRYDGSAVTVWVDGVQKTASAAANVSFIASLTADRYLA